MDFQSSAGRNILSSCAPGVHQAINPLTAFNGYYGGIIEGVPYCIIEMHNILPYQAFIIL